MGTLISTSNDLLKYIPTAEGFNPDPGSSELERFESFVDEAELWMRNELLGDDLFDFIAEINAGGSFVFSGEFAFGYKAEPAAIVDAAKRVIAVKAYRDCIPFVDLVQTPTGFGIVSNGNLAPASKERVERLIQRLDFRLSESVDNLISFVFSYSQFRDEWKKSVNFEYYTESLFMTAAGLRRAGVKDAMRSTLDELHPDLLLAQADVSHIVGVEYMDALISKRREALLTDKDAAMIARLQVIVGLIVTDDVMKAYELLEKAVNVMTFDIDSYPEYKASEAYLLKIGAKFENDEESAVFFGSV